MADPVLSLNTITRYETVAIDDIKYRLLPREAMSLHDSIKSEEEQLALGELLQFEKPTDKQKKRIAELMASLCQRLLEAPPHVHASLTDPQRLQILNAFIELPQNKPRPTAEAKSRTATRSNGAKRSRGSRASTTAQASTTGGSASRSHSSTRVIG